MRALLFCLALLLSFSLPAKHVRRASQGDAPSLDPHAQNENVTKQVNAMVCVHRLGYDKEMKLVPWLATSWENPDSKTWIFHLRNIPLTYRPVPDIA